jgi:ABC-2 type transport system ATP-binding protein
MKQSLLRQELILDADDRDQLGKELSELGLPYTMEDHIVVSFRGRNMTAQEIITRLKTRLTVLKIKEPSLEDAYIEYLNRTGGDMI